MGLEKILMELYFFYANVQLINRLVLFLSPFSTKTNWKDNIVLYLLHMIANPDYKVKILFKRFLLPKEYFSSKPCFSF